MGDGSGYQEGHTLCMLSGGSGVGESPRVCLGCSSAPCMAWRQGVDCIAVDRPPARLPVRPARAARAAYRAGRGCSVDHTAARCAPDVMAMGGRTRGTDALDKGPHA